MGSCCCVLLKLVVAAHSMAQCISGAAMSTSLCSAQRGAYHSVYLSFSSRPGIAYSSYLPPCAHAETGPYMQGPYLIGALSNGGSFT